MSCIENEVIYEKNLELFHEQVFSDYDLEKLVIDYFATPEEVWRAKEIGKGDEYEETVNRAFDAVWKADIEIACCEDAKTALEWWKKRENRKEEGEK